MDKIKAAGFDRYADVSGSFNDEDIMAAFKEVDGDNSGSLSIRVRKAEDTSCSFMSLSSGSQTGHQVSGKEIRPQRRKLCSC